MDTNKPRVEFNEMAEWFSEMNPGLVPNKTNVGRFARTIGYHLAKQMVNLKIYYFYLKNR